LLRLLVPLDGDRGNPTGYIGALVIVSGGGQFLAIAEHTAGTVESFVLDAQGLPLFVSHPHGHVDYGIPLASPLVGDGPGESARYEDRLGVMVIGTIVPVPDMNWRVVTEAPVALALAELSALRRVSILLAAVFVGLVVLSSLFVAAQIVQPVRRLVEGARRIGAGDLDARVDVTGQDEIGTLGAAFNQMAAALSESLTQIERLHRREMERAGQLATVGELASGVAHEIKNPVVSLSNGLDLVTRHVRKDPALDAIVAEMSRKLARIEMAIRDLLTFARPPEPSLSPTAVRHLLNRAVTLVRPAADAAGVQLNIESQPTLPAVLVDEDLIAQVLVNLVVNAVQATGRDGKVLLVARGTGGGVQVEVRDDGRGIPPDRLGKIFRPFFTTKHRGTGLGLSISKGIMEKHGGTLTVDSTVDVGTTFYLTLSVAEASIEADEESGHSAATRE
jgi:signal transduction histidine kinase